MVVTTGYGEITGPKGLVKEIDTYTCVHCSRVRTTKSTEKGEGDPGGICRKCMGPICSLCIAKECIPFERKLDLYERRQKLFKAMGLEL